MGAINDGSSETAKEILVKWDELSSAVPLVIKKQAHCEDKETKVQDGSGSATLPGPHCQLALCLLSTELAEGHTCLKVQSRWSLCTCWRGQGGISMTHLLPYPAPLSPTLHHHHLTLTPFMDSRAPEARVSRLPLPLLLRCGEEEGESSM